MTTKDQERKALEEIKAIVEKIGGDDSYIGMAFKGCFEIALENIENDFGDSWIDRWDSATKENGKLRDELDQMKKEAEATEAELEVVKDQLEKVREIRDQWKDEATATDELLVAERKDRQEATSRAATLETENMKLKAKLYDLMTV